MHVIYDFMILKLIISRDISCKILLLSKTSTVEPQNLAMYDATLCAADAS